MRLVGGKRTESWWLYAIAGALMIGGPVWRELFVSRYPVRPELFVFPLAAAAIGALVALGSRLVGGLLGTAVFGGLLFVFTDLQLDLHQSIRTVVLVAACLGLALLLASHRAAISAIALGTFYVSSLTRPNVAAPEKPGTTRTAQGPGRVLVHIILDEQWGVGGLRAAGDTVTADFLEDFYLARGFELYEAAYSRYAWTRQSIPSVLSLGQPLSFNAGKKMMRGLVFDLSLRTNPYLERLRGQGYDIRVSQSTSIDYCSAANVVVASCDALSANSIANMGFIDGSWTTRGLYIARFFLNTRSHVYHRLHPEPMTWRRSVAGSGLETLNRLTEAIPKHQAAQTAYFVHAMLPHRPVQMDSECRVLADPSGQFGSDDPGHPNDSPWRAALRSYAGQVRCAHEALAMMIAAVDSTVGRDQSIIVVHGDHGSRMHPRSPAKWGLNDFTVTEMNSMFPALLAVRRPNVAAVVHAEPVPLQDFLWALVGSDFTGPLPKTWQHYLRQTDSSSTMVTERPLSADDMVWTRRPQ